MRRTLWFHIPLAFAAITAAFIAGCGGGSQSIVPGGESLGAAAPPTGVAVADADENGGAVWQMNEPGDSQSAASRTITQAPTLISPINEQQVVKSEGVTFKWNAVSGATKYMIAISQTTSFSRQYLLLSDSRGAATQKTFAVISPSQPDGLYYWRARASDKSNPKPKTNSDWGPYSTTGVLNLVSQTCGTSTTGTVLGTITDASTNQAIGSATVELDTAQTDVTDSSGEYSIPNVAVGLHTGVVKKSGYLSAAIEATVAARDCVEVNARLQPSGSSGGPPPPPIFP